MSRQNSRAATPTKQAQPVHTSARQAIARFKAKLVKGARFKVAWRLRDALDLSITDQPFTTWTGTVIETPENGPAIVEYSHLIVNEVFPPPNQDGGWLYEIDEPNSSVSAPVREPPQLKRQIVERDSKDEAATTTAAKEPPTASQSKPETGEVILLMEVLRQEIEELKRKRSRPEEDKTLQNGQAQAVNETAMNSSWTQGQAQPMWTAGGQYQATPWNGAMPTSQLMGQNALLQPMYGANGQMNGLPQLTGQMQSMYSSPYQQAVNPVQQQQAYTTGFASVDATMDATQRILQGKVLYLVPNLLFVPLSIPDKFKPFYAHLWINRVNQGENVEIVATAWNAAFSDIMNRRIPHVMAVIMIRMLKNQITNGIKTCLWRPTTVEQWKVAFEPFLMMLVQFTAHEKGSPQAITLHDRISAITTEINVTTLLHNIK